MKLALVIFEPNDLKHISFPKMISKNSIKTQRELLGLLIPKEKKSRTKLLLSGLSSDLF